MSKARNNARNDRLKRDYLIWLGQARQRSPSTVDQVRHAIDRYETYTGFKDFGTFNREQAIGFKHALLETVAHRSGKPVSLSTAHYVLQACKDFLRLAAQQAGISAGDLPARHRLSQPFQGRGEPGPHHQAQGLPQRRGVPAGHNVHAGCQ